MAAYYPDNPSKLQQVGEKQQKHFEREILNSYLFGLSDTINADVIRLENKDGGKGIEFHKGENIKLVNRIWYCFIRMEALINGRRFKNIKDVTNKCEKARQYQMDLQLLYEETRNNSQNNIIAITQLSNNDFNGKHRRFVESFSRICDEYTLPKPDILYFNRI